MRIESLVVNQVEAHSAHSVNAEGEQVVAAAAAAAALVDAESEPTVVDELILQVQQIEVVFVCEVAVPTNSGPK